MLNSNSTLLIQIVKLYVPASVILQLIILNIDNNGCNVVTGLLIEAAKRDFSSLQCEGRYVRVDWSIVSSIERIGVQTLQEPKTAENLQYVFNPICCACSNKAHSNAGGSMRWLHITY